MTDFKALFEAVPGLYLVLSPDFTILAASDAYLRGTMTVREEITGRNLFDVFPANPEDPHATGVQNLRASLLRVLATKKADTMAVQKYDIPRPEAKGGGFEERYWSPSNSPVLDTNGNVSYIIHRVEDVTEVITSNAQVDVSRNFLQNIIDCVADPIFVKDEKHRLIGGNEAMWKLFGRPAREILGKSDYDFFPKEEADIFWQKDQEVFDSGETNINIENFTDAAGDIHIISTKKACFKTPRGEKILVGIIRDITDIQRMQEKLKENDEARLKSIMDYSGRLVYIKDLEGRYLQANAEFLRMVGWEDKDAIGKTNYDFFPKEYADRFRKNDMQVIESGTSLEFEQIVPYDDGPHFYTAVKFPLYDADNNVYALCGIATDITERKRAEQKIQQMMAELTESNIELERFAYICSHDLQEPLRMITNFTQRLVKHMEGNLDEKASHYVKYIIEGATNARELINDILTYARVSNTMEEEEPVDCRATLSIVMKNLEMAIAESGVIITHDALPVVLAHKTRVAQLLQNLIGNAIKFRRRDVPPQIRLSAKRVNNFWQFCVEDNGIGIPEEYFEKIFVIFQRLGKRGDYPGTGIGLAICKKIVDSYRGNIWLESTPGVGSRFYFTLPAETSYEDMPHAAPSF